MINNKDINKIVASNNKIEIYSDEENSEEIDLDDSYSEDSDEKNSADSDEGNSEEIYPDDSCSEESDEENSDDSDEENSNKNIQVRRVECIKLFFQKIIVKKNKKNMTFF